MTFPDLLEIARNAKADYPAGELVVTLNSYIRDICNEVEPFIRMESITTDGTTVEFLHTDLSETFQTYFMKAADVKYPGKVLHLLRDGLENDYVFEIQQDSLLIGIRGAIQVNPIPAGETIEFYYYAYPDFVTLETETLPMKQMHSFFLWQLKADIFSEKRQWDRAGYFKRKAERAITLYRRMIQGKVFSELLT